MALKSKYVKLKPKIKDCSGSRKLIFEKMK